MSRAPTLRHRVAQTQIHDPENGVIGNCMAASFASVAGETIDAWNHITSFPDDWYALVEEEWRKRGYAVVRIGAEYCPGGAPPGVGFCSGPSPRDFSHMVVVEDGRIVHDPHPSQGGLKSKEVWWMLWPLAEATG